MLVIGRNRNQKIIITDKRTNETIEVMVSEIFIHPDMGRAVKLAFDASNDYSIMREELLDTEKEVYFKNKRVK
jgi:sRNA-binding carbon storage regulator CsrA